MYKICIKYSYAFIHAVAVSEKRKEKYCNYIKIPKVKIKK